MTARAASTPTTAAKITSRSIVVPFLNVSDGGTKVSQELRTFAFEFTVREQRREPGGGRVRKRRKAKRELAARVTARTVVR
jgi:hypothetical protein